MLKKFSLAVFTVMLMAVTSLAATWTVDIPHSSVNFTVKHLVISKVTGKFDGFSGTINFDGENLDKGSVEFTVDMATVDTDNENRDNHLKSADFFDVEKFPKMTFKSTKVIPGEDNEFKLVGNLTIRDVTREVTFDCVFNGVVSFMGATKAGFSARTTIDRQDFNVSWSKSLDSGGLVVSDEVEIYIEIEANQES